MSVIIPAYNIENYIKQCIDSVRGQTYRNLEIIVVDDGSTDGTSRICDLAASDDGRVKVLHQPNGGLSRARNAGIGASSGDYLYFVDGDDLVHLRCIETLLSIMKKEECDIAQCRTYAFLDENKIPTDLPEEKHEVYTGKRMCEHMLFGSKYGGDITVAWDKLYRRAVFEKRRFNDGMLYEDVAIMHELLWKADKVAITNLQLAFYRSMREGSITHSGHKKFEDQIKADLIQLRFFQDRGEHRLEGQCYYILSNDLAKLRIYKGDAGGKIKEKHKKIMRKANHAEMAFVKKCLINLGYRCPRTWFWIWEARRKIKGKIEWGRKGEKISCVRTECRGMRIS